MPDPGSPWEREDPSDGFGYLPFPIRTPEDQAKWNACKEHYAKRRDRGVLGSAAVLKWERKR